MKFAFIEAEKARWPVAPMCEVLSVSRSGFYAWLSRSPSPREREDRRLAVEIASIHAESRRRYGSPRVHAELRERGSGAGRKRIARLSGSRDFERVRSGASARRRTPGTTCPSPTMSSTDASRRANRMPCG